MEPSPIKFTVLLNLITYLVFFILYFLLLFIYFIMSLGSPSSELSTMESVSSIAPKSLKPLATAQKLFYTLKKRILDTNGPSYFELGVMSPETGHLVARSLCEDGNVERKSIAYLI